MTDSVAPLTLCSEAPNTVPVNSCPICLSSKENLTSGDQGRTKLLYSAKILNDDIGRCILAIPLSQFCIIKYHLRPCYVNYVRKADKKKAQDDKISSTDMSEDISGDNTSPNLDPRRSKRRKRGSSSSSSSVTMIRNPETCYKNVLIKPNYAWVSLLILVSSSGINALTRVGSSSR